MNKARRTYLDSSDKVVKAEKLDTREEVENMARQKTVMEVIEEVKRGIVTNCNLLNVRKEPNSDAEVLFTIPYSTKVVIENYYSTDDFYKICTASGMEGFCMKTYVAIQE